MILRELTVVPLLVGYTGIGVDVDVDLVVVADVSESTSADEVERSDEVRERRRSGVVVVVVVVDDLGRGTAIVEGEERGAKATREDAGVAYAEMTTAAVAIMVTRERIDAAVIETNDDDDDDLGPLLLLLLLLGAGSDSGSGSGDFDISVAKKRLIVYPPRDVHSLRF